MQYRFLDPGDEKLIETSELPCEGIAVAVRTTGYEAGEDEVVELSVVDLDGNALFSKAVKPQNKEEWEPSDASGGLAPADVSEAPELYQFEEEISALYEGALTVVYQHEAFAESVIESSWVTLPRHSVQDLITLFCESHCTVDYPDNPAGVATLAGIADYYGISCSETSTASQAQTIAACYRALVQEHADERLAKGEEYWRRRDERLAAEAAQDANAAAVVAQREKNLNRMNGMMWVVACLIFISIIIQVYQRGLDASLMIVFGVAAVFALTRAIASFRK